MLTWPIKLSDLRPKLTAPIDQNDIHTLEFDCPKHPNARISIKCSLTVFGVVRHPGTWTLEFDWMNPQATITITPSVISRGHGRNIPCDFHCIIRNGMLHPG